MMIRKAGLNDLPGLSELFNQYRVFYRKQPDVPAAQQFLKDRLEKKESEIFVADEEGSLLGFVQLYPIFSSTRMQRLWLLNDLFVDESARGRGLSILLMDAAKELARATGACGLTLETEKTNTTGNKLYPKQGFVLNKEHNFYSWDV